MIKSVDSAIMLQRTTDYVRDSSAQIKKNELMHDQASKMNHEHNEHEMQFVAQLENVREKKVHRDPEKKRQTPLPPPKRSKGHKEDSSAPDVGYAQRQHIDIEI